MTAHRTTIRATGRADRQGFPRLGGLRSAVVLAPDLWALLILSLAAVLSRLYANPLYAGEPSSDEYFYGLYAIEIAHALTRGDLGAASALSIETRIIGFEVGALLGLLPLDPISLGRLIQALFNALTVPLVYALARTFGWRVSASVAAATLLLALPELWESAWRYWADSQAVFLATATLLAGLRAAYRPALLGVLAPVVLLVLTFLTKEFVAVATLPALVAVVPLAVGERLMSRRGGRAGRLALAVVTLIVAVAGLAAAVAGPAVLATLKGTAPAGPVLRTVLSIERLLNGLPVVGERLGDYLVALDQQFGPDRFGTGLVVFWALGGLVLLAQAPRAAARWTLGSGTPWEPFIWLLALVVWLPGLAVGWALAWEATRASPAMQAVLVGAALAVGPGQLWLERAGVAQSAGSRPANGVLSSRAAVGLAVLGLLVTSFVVLRLVIWAAPDLRAAFTPRSFLPTMPALALIAGLGMAELARFVAAIAALARPRVGRVAAPAALAAALLATLVWLTPTEEHLASEPLLGRRADRRGDLATPEGLRITSLVEAEGWLQANLLPTDRIMTSMPRHVAWYARTGLEGYANTVTTGDLATTWPERYEKILAWLEQPSEVDYIVDYNVHWREASSTEATFWYALYDWLRARPYLEEAYSRRDPNGRIVFYVFRNHRWAVAPTHLERIAGAP